MILDKSLQLASGQGSITNAAVYSTNCIDLSDANGLQTYDAPAYVIVRVGTAFASGTSLTFELISSSAAITDTAGSGAADETVEASSGAILTAALTKDTIVWKCKLPDKIRERYLAVKATPAGTFNAGTMDIEITPHVPFGF
jgi:hypothetical protein